MKNLHLIPTDKLSILISSGKEFNILNYPVVDKRCKHIYITSDEEIKPNKYALINGVLCKTELLEDRIVSRPLGYGGTMDICKSEYSEITITTDQDLITNGVQAIDDEFLEWFVKNPNCEEIEVVKQMLCDYCGQEHCDNLRCRGHEDSIWYEIIIPKEEPLTKLQIAKNIDDIGIGKEEPKQKYICYKCQNKTSNIMKNLHLIPTNKPSRLCKTDKLRLYPNGLTPKSQGLCKNQNICITNDEVIKERDWYIADNKVYRASVDHMPELYTYPCKKIILTTDEDLIKDCVQPINNEFLEWFVKNPSCEFVEVENMACSGYKIIIPKEEPKQEIIEDKIYQAIGLSANKQGIINQALATSKVMDILKKEIIVKQETLEEAAERYEETDFNTTPTEETSQMMIQRAFINGVKWQQERSYSEAIEFIEWINDPINPFIKHNNKWIQACGNSTSWTTKELFEQFKKK